MRSGASSSSGCDARIQPAQHRLTVWNPWRTYVLDAPGTVDPAVPRERIASGEQRLAAVTLIANDMQAPQNRQWSVGVGRRITPALLLNLDYVSQDVRDLLAELNLNWLDRSVAPARRALTERYGDIVVWDDFARARSTGRCSPS